MKCGGRVEVVGEGSEPGGWGVLNLEKGTDCGLAAAQLWLSQDNVAKTMLKRSPVQSL